MAQPNVPGFSVFVNEPVYRTVLDLPNAYQPPNLFSPTTQSPF